MMLDIQGKVAAEIVPPSNLEAEQALLAAILVNNAAYHRVSDDLRAEHFALGVHGRIYEAIGKQIAAGGVANPVTLKSFFENDPALIEAGGSKYLARLAVSVVTIINSEDYARTIRDCWMRREVMSLAQEAVEAAALDFEDGSSSILEKLENGLLSLHDAGRRSNSVRFLAEFGEDAIAAADRAFKRKGQLTGIGTGLLDLDKLTGGLQPSDLIYLAGRPSMGKSALAGTVALNAALLGHPVYLATPEMSGEQVALRALSVRTRLASQRIRSGQIEADDFGRMIEANRELAQLPVQVDDAGGITLAALRSRLRRFLSRVDRMPGVKAQDGEAIKALLIIDYIQLMNAGGKRSNNRNEDMSELSRGLKALAKELGVPVLALSQLSRAVEGRDNKRPMLSDLRDSGSLEQDADVVAFIYREEYYLQREEPARRDGERAETFENRHMDWLDRLNKSRNVAEINIAKQRHGPTGKVLLRFDPETTSFENLSTL